jgi:hypothetical protein
LISSGKRRPAQRVALIATKPSKEPICYFEFRSGDLNL